MEILIEEENEKYIFKVKDLPIKYHDSIKHWFFHEENGVFIKVYDKNTLMFPFNLGKAINNYSKNLVKMLDSVMDNELFDWVSSLYRVAKKLNDNEIDWWLTGSAACAVRGIDILPHDIDIVTYKSMIPRIQSTFSDITIEPFHHINDWIFDGFGIIYLNGRIDIAFNPNENSDQYGNFDFGLYASKNLDVLIWKDFKIKVPPVNLHIKPNENRERIDRVQKIKSYIELSHNDV